MQTAPERRWMMKVHSTRLAVELLEDRCVPSTVAYGDVNNDGREDMAVLTAHKTITVSLANQDSTYTVSAILTSPKPIESVSVDNDYNQDGIRAIIGRSSKQSGSYYSAMWLGNGDGTFTHFEPPQWPKKGPPHSGW